MSRKIFSQEGLLAGYSCHYNCHHSWPVLSKRIFSGNALKSLILTKKLSKTTQLVQQYNDLIIDLNFYICRSESNHQVGPGLLHIQYNPKHEKIHIHLFEIGSDLFISSSYTIRENQWHHIKIDHRFTDSGCRTELLVDFTLLDVLSNDCGSYSVPETEVFSPTKDHTNTPATGYVDSFRFVWLWVTISYFLMCLKFIE